MKLMSNIEFEKVERPLVMTGAYISRIIRGGIDFAREDTSNMTPGQQEAIRAGLAWVDGDTETGLRIRYVLPSPLSSEQTDAMVTTNDDATDEEAANLWNDLDASQRRRLDFHYTTAPFRDLLELKLFDICGARTDLGRRVAAHGASLRRRR